jgi:hypothetical protein
MPPGSAPPFLGPNPWYDVTHPHFNADPRGVRDATEAINNALHVCGAAGGGTVFLPPGKYKISGQLVLASNTRVLGASVGATVISQTADGKDCFRIASDTSIANVTISDLQITLASESPTRPAFAFNLINACRVYVDRILITHYHSGIQLSSASGKDNTVPAYCYFNNLDFHYLAKDTGYGIVVYSGGDVDFTNCVFACVAGKECAAGVLIYNTLGAVDFFNCEFEHMGTGCIIQPGGKPLNQVEYCHFTRCYFDAPRQHALQIDTGASDAQISGLVFDQCWFAYAQRGFGVFVGNDGGVVPADKKWLSGLTFSKCQIYAAWRFGVLVNSAAWSNIDIVDCHVAANGQAHDNAYDGVHFVKGCRHFKVRGCRIGPCDGLDQYVNQQRYGLFVDAGCRDFIISDNDLTGNRLGGLKNLTPPAPQLAPVFYTTNNLGA